MIGLLKLGMAILWGSCAWAGDQYTKDQLRARFYFDLGPAEVDVSSYPPEQQNNYKEFTEHCSKCHTLARPINAPIVTKTDWHRFVLRMHRRTTIKAGSDIPADDARKIVDFLAYDSQRRKVEHKASFEAQTQELKNLFEKVQKERMRLQAEENKKKARVTPPEVQSQPAPHP